MHLSRPIGRDQRGGRQILLRHDLGERTVFAAAENPLFGEVTGTVAAALKFNGQLATSERGRGQFSSEIMLVNLLYLLARLVHFGDRLRHRSRRQLITVHGQEMEPLGVKNTFQWNRKTHANSLVGRFRLERNLNVEWAPRLCGKGGQSGEHRHNRDKHHNRSSRSAPHNTSIATASASTDTLAAGGHLPRKYNVFGLRVRGRIAIRAHRIIRQRAALPWTDILAAGEAGGTDYRKAKKNKSPFHLDSFLVSALISCWYCFTVSLP